MDKEELARPYCRSFFYQLAFNLVEPLGERGALDSHGLLVPEQALVIEPRYIPVSPGKEEARAEAICVETLIWE